MKYKKLQTRAEAFELIEAINRRGNFIALDLETTGLNTRTGSIICAVIATNISSHDQEPSGEAYWIDASFLGVLNAISVPLVLHNFKFDFAMLHTAGVNLINKTFYDTMLIHHLLDETAEHGLDSIVQKEYNDSYKEIFWANNKTFQEAGEDAQLEYACKDVIYTGHLYQKFMHTFKVSEMPQSLLSHVHGLARAFYDVELRGVRVDLDYTIKLGEQLNAEIAELKQTLSKTFPETKLVAISEQLKKMEKLKTPAARQRVQLPEFNWDSHKQLKDLLYTELGLPPITKRSKATKQDTLSVDDDALAELQAYNENIAQIRAYKDKKKILGSFVEGTLERQVGGVIYPKFNVNGTVTGRVSSSDPNLQQLPREGGVRGIYVPAHGHKFVSSDFGMIEVVVAAHFSQDKNLLKIIYEGASKHDITAESLGIPRQTAKTLNFAIGYGATEHKVKQILDCSLEEAKKALVAYWATYAGEKSVIDACQKRVNAGLPIISLFGRRRRFKAVFETKWEREAAYRQAYNALIQGSAADITHHAYTTYATQMRELSYGRALFEVHDQILGEARNDVAQAALDLLNTTMVESGKYAGLSVPLTVDGQGPMDKWED